MEGTGGTESPAPAPPAPPDDAGDAFERAATVGAAPRGAAPSTGPGAVEPARGRRVAAVVVVVLVVLAGGGLVAFMLLRGDDGPSYPDEWAAEVLPYVEIVEDLRALDFERPIHVDFLPEDEFREQVTADDADLSEEDREAIEHVTGLLRALGLVEGDLDLFEASNDLAGEGFLGFYSHETKRITMRGTELTPDVRSTLVHELTHALQDQHFAMGDRFDVLDDAGDDAAATAWRALVEGDASRIEAAYRDSLPEEDRVALDEAVAARSEGYEAGTEDVPVVLQTFQAAPYALGEALLGLVEELHGGFAIDGIFQDPPLSEEHLLDPWTLLADDAPQVTTEPKLAAGDEELDRGAFGALSWLLVLAERIPLVQALDATDGWGGDRYVSFTRDGASCVRASYRGDTSEDTGEMLAALEAWIGAHDGDAASVAEMGAELRFESCDPGRTATGLGRGVSDDALGIILARTYLTIEVLRQGATDTQARCFGDALVHEFGLEQLDDPEAALDPATQQRIAELAAGCR